MLLNKRFSLLSHIGFSCFFLLVSSTSSAQGWRATNYPYAKLPAKAKQLLDTIPGREVTLDLVVKSGVKKSDSFQSIVASQATTKASQLMSEAATDLHFFAGASYTDNRNEPTSSFGTTSQTNSGFNIGFNKGFSTGTRLTTSLMVGNFSYTLSPSLNVPAPGTQSNTELEFKIEQDLWKNGFGRATSLKLESGELMSQANEWSAMKDAEDWFLQLSDIFYGAWLAQSQARTAQTSVVRSERLARITRIKLKRGTAERPDLLQVESNLASARVGLANAEKAVNDVWRKLVVTLKFPDAWLSISGMKVPVAIFPVKAETISVCGSAQQISQEPANTSETESVRWMASAAEKSYQASRSEMNPDLHLELSAKGNAIDSDAGTSFNDAVGGRHPQLTALLKLTVPLDNSLAKGQAMQAYKEHKQALALSSMKSSNLKVDWVNACAELFRAKRSAAILKSAFQMQKERASLEERRFRNGRITAPQVILAEEEATRAELSWLQSEVDLRKSAWRVEKFSGGIRNYMENLKRLASAKATN